MNHSFHVILYSNHDFSVLAACLWSGGRPQGPHCLLVFHALCGWLSPGSTDIYVLMTLKGKSSAPVSFLNFIHYFQFPARSSNTSHSSLPKLHKPASSSVFSVSFDDFTIHPVTQEACPWWIIYDSSLTSHLWVGTISIYISGSWALGNFSN